MSTDHTDVPARLAPPPHLLTVAEVCQTLNLSRPTVARLLARKAIFSVCIGRSRRIPLSAVDAFVAGLIAAEGVGSADAPHR